MKKAVFISFVVMLAIFSLIYFLAFQPLLQILNGYSAKRICSSHFIADRNLKDIEKQDLAYPASWCSGEIDIENKLAHSSILGLSKRTAVYRPGFGCTLKPHNNSLRPTTNLPPTKASERFWPYGNIIRDTIYSSVNKSQLDEVISEAFGTADKTRAVIVAKAGNIIAEKYEQGFDKDTELLGWSMTKSITNNLVGILVKQGKLSPDQSNLLEVWNDERANITLENLLTMGSDLEWNEEYGYLSDVTRMLYLTDDASNYAINKNIRQQIGTTYVYSSGTTNIISKLIKNQFETEEAYLKFPHEALFRKLGIDATMELDGDNNYIMSSYAYMTARDWAKLGQFWLQDGNWMGEQILPPGWMDYSTTSGIGINGIYGAHFWLNSDSFLYHDVPPDMFASRGFQGQQVVVIPSMELVIVRFGVDEGIETFDYNKFLSSIIATIK